MPLSLDQGSPESLGLPSGAVLARLDALAADGLELHGFTLRRSGRVVAGGHWFPYGPERVHHVYSLSKAFAAVGVGLLVQEGRLSVEDRVVDLFTDALPPVVGEHLRAMRVEDLLTMRTGHAADVTDALVAAGDGDWVTAFLAQPVAFQPGTHFVYNSGASFLLSALVQRVTGETLLAFLTPRLLEPLGVRGARWVSNAGGVNLGGWGLHLRTVDVASFGQLLLDRGTWQGQRLLSAAWVDAMRAAHVPPGTTPGDDKSDWAQGYGYQVWRCRHGAYRADGAFGQFCVVMPEQDMVLAVTAGVGDMGRVLDHTWAHLLGGVQDAPLPPSAHTEALRVRCAGLTLPVPEILDPPPLRDVQAHFTFDPNDEGWAAATLTVTGERGTLILDGRVPNTVRFTLNAWEEQTLNTWGTTVALTVRAGWQADGTLALTLLLIEDGARWEVRWPAPDAPLSVQLCAPHYGEGHTLSARPSTLGA
ncbi:serine hydrolase [Deinococcus soli (ex Cha et al. 2016)]|uniref:CubicO group peptidase (Beta-lactamase class C family) n=2 Tax=Deinococcus soli (ex Cha et al. 2016) TaxID=1309411 RepID=A0ACC6KK20_9DEIO|nr:serine hydrolase [Deinococcus soli (ex Cha et al. 2016)]MDR6220314.1 CubicO group peptidase (beta-lactamase class C family) [Deinococcus soli (ex Cha et al. 2016)]MDR6330169.1 CubicO group peptidase (beta-lactamase class C family) [Deinococcus soli (ex Cha et al. 2016)]MDR6752878.1 CubicO group peptidase (beta-lactamase class C family) [Deinococcus soli (ex Cha et al. 2016)]